MHVVAGLDGTTPRGVGPVSWLVLGGLGNFSQNESTEAKTGNVRLTRLRNALGPSYRGSDGAPGAGHRTAPSRAACRSICSAGPDSITRDQVDNLTYTGVQKGYNQ